MRPLQGRAPPAQLVHSPDGVTRCLQISKAGLKLIDCRCWGPSASGRSRAVAAASVALASPKAQRLRAELTTGSSHLSACFKVFGFSG